MLKISMRYTWTNITILQIYFTNATTNITSTSNNNDDV